MTQKPHKPEATSDNERLSSTRSSDPESEHGDASATGLKRDAPRSSALPCREWQGQLGGRGYGVVPIWARIDGERYAHRAAFIAAHGPIPPGHLVRHTCDNRPCIEPTHLVSGTHADNMRDRMERGRQARGERHGRSVLSDAQLAEVRSLLEAGRRRVDIARRFGVSKSLITFIAQGKRRGPPRPSTPEEAAYAAAMMRKCRAARTEQGASL